MRISALLLVLAAGGWWPGSAVGQGKDQRVADAHQAKGGHDRVRKLTEAAAQYRQQGKLREAIEYATMASAEAEKNNLDADLAGALMELSRSQKARGLVEQAIGTTLRVTMVNGTYHSPYRTEAMLQLAELYLDLGYPQKTLEYLTETRTSTSAKQMDRPRFLRAEARAKSRLLKPDALVEYMEAAVSEAQNCNDRTLLLDLTSIQATALTQTGKLPEALTAEEQVMKLAIALDRPFEAGVCANNLGALNHRMGRTQEALNAYAKGLIMVEDLPYVQINMRANAALANAQAGHTETAVRLLEDAMSQMKDEPLVSLMPRILRTLAAVRLRQGDLASAQEAALAALGAAEENNDLDEQSAACDLLVTVLERRDLGQEARSFERRARELDRRRGVIKDQVKGEHEAQLLRLQRIEREQADILNREQRKETKLRQLALDAENREKQFSLLTYEKQLEEAARREAIMAQERSEQELQLAQAMLESERQDRMIKELDDGRLIQSLNLTKMELEKKNREKALEVLRERNTAIEAEKQREKVSRKYTAIIAVVAAVVALVTIGAWLNTRRKKRTIQQQHEQISEINRELAARNRDIHSSITYAQTIQSAILPTEDDLRELVPESFLMYRPLDVVSGDLPFIKRIGDRIFVAAIDCTGHGVPAAMMTFIAYYGMNELLAQYLHSPAGIILDQLHDHVQRTMEGREKNTVYNDGFDIGLCVIDLTERKIGFAGAQLPLIIQRNGEAIRLKGDILPIGDKHFERAKGYRTHELELQDGDALFLLSDGLIHQFGGEDGRKKFSMKRLMGLLNETAGMDLEQIRETTESHFDEWKKEHPQTDDVLFIGMRFAA